MTKNSAPAPVFPRRANGNEVRMLNQGPGVGRAIETSVGVDGKRRAVQTLGLLRSTADGWVTTDLDGLDPQTHVTQVEALARFV
jgi:hypothetical protein